MRKRKQAPAAACLDEQLPAKLSADIEDLGFSDTTRLEVGEAHLVMYSLIVKPHEFKDERHLSCN